MTEQAHAKDADINTIMAKAARQGFIDRPSRAEPMYGDFTNVTDFHGALAQVDQAVQSFMELPADLRKKFHNDPGALIDYVSNAENEEEARELGILPKLTSAASKSEAAGPASAPEGSEASPVPAATPEASPAAEEAPKGPGTGAE